MEISDDLEVLLRDCILHYQFLSHCFPFPHCCILSALHFFPPSLHLTRALQGSPFLSPAPSSSYSAAFHLSFPISWLPLVSVLQTTSYIQYIHAANSHLTKKLLPYQGPLETWILVHYIGNLQYFLLTKPANWLSISNKPVGYLTPPVVMPVLLTLQAREVLGALDHKGMLHPWINKKIYIGYIINEVQHLHRLVQLHQLNGLKN